MTEKRHLLPARWFLLLVFIMVFAAIFRDFLAGDRAIVQSSEMGIEFPIFSKKAVGEEVNWKIMPLVPYNPESMDNADRILIPPFGKNLSEPSAKYRHWLGTDGLGRDVMAGIIYGFRIALIIALLSGIVSLFLGYSLGAIAGYYGNKGFRMNILYLIALVLIFLFYTFYAYWSAVVGDSFSIVLLLAVLGLAALMIYMGLKSEKFRLRIPMDSIVMRTVDFFSSIPALLILLVLSVALRGWNVYEIAILIGFLRWPTLSRHVRAEVMHLRNSEEIEYTKGLGFSDYFILSRRVLMRSIQSALVVLAFVTASSIILEATLSFLGLGLPPETISWGNLMHQSRSYPDAWWLVVFPGIILFLIVYGLNDWGRKINKAVFQGTR